MKIFFIVPPNIHYIEPYSYVKADKINSPRMVVKDLDSLPFPAYDLIAVEKYSNLLACSENSINIMTSRGCPQKCAFCDLRGTPYRFHSPQHILKEIRLWADKGMTEFFIQDDNFRFIRY